MGELCVYDTGTLADYYSSIVNNRSLREILEFQNTYLVYTFDKLSRLRIRI
jgi:hypothetical protein